MYETLLLHETKAKKTTNKLSVDSRRPPSRGLNSVAKRHLTTTCHVTNLVRVLVLYQVLYFTLKCLILPLPCSPGAARCAAEVRPSAGQHHGDGRSRGDDVVRCRR
jgi:hypothetical protein